MVLPRMSDIRCVAAVGTACGGSSYTPKDTDTATATTACPAATEASRSSRRGDYHYRQFQLRRTTHGVAGATVSVTNNASAAHSVTSQTAGQFDVHLAGNGEATFTAPTQPGEYAFYCTYHPSMKGTLIVQ